MVPSWRGADAAYSKAYRILEKMGRSHVQIDRDRRGRPIRCHPSDEMRDLVDALNKGDEERIKGLILLHGPA